MEILNITDTPPSKILITPTRKQIVDIFLWNESVRSKLDQGENMGWLQLISENILTYAQQWSDMLKQSNIDTLWISSMIERTHNSLIDSFAVKLLIYNDKLIAAIRLQQQPSHGIIDWESIFQRWSLIVDSNYRDKDQDYRLWISWILIHLLNQQFDHLPVYGITSNPKVRDWSIKNWSYWFDMNEIKYLFNNFYNYIVDKRWGKNFSDKKKSANSDFANLWNKENIEDYYCTMNNELYESLISKMSDIKKHEIKTYIENRGKLL